MSQLIEFLDSSCPFNQCENGGQCSIRSPNENFNCDCLLGYHGPTCDTGFLKTYFSSPSFKPEKKGGKKNYLAFYCSLIPKEENAEWVQTLANGQTVNGTCISGYYGTVSRTCTRNGLNGDWGSISGSCDGTSFTLNDMFQRKLKEMN